MTTRVETTPILDLVSRLRRAGIQLWVEGDRLRYSAPRGALTDPLRAELVERKEEVIAFLAEVREAARPEEVVLTPVPREGDLPLSASQLRQWFLDRLEPGNPGYNVPAAVEMTGKLEVAAFHRSLGEVVRRHEALRTTFPEEGGRPRQAIAPHLAPALPVVDLSALAPGRARAAAWRLAEAEPRRPFDLAVGPLLRAVLVRLAGRDHLFLLTLHHIISDGWSIGIFVREMAVLYAAFSHGRPSPLPELEVQYADFAAWQRRRLSGEGLERLISYWRRRLRGLPPALPLPTDRPRPPVQTFRGAEEPFDLGEERSAVLRELGRRRGASPFMVLLAALEALLARYTGQTDLAVGTYIANRNRPEVEGLIGFFVNTLVIRGDLAGEPAFDQLLDRVRRATLAAYAHQDLPFEQVLEAVHPERDLARTPLFQVMLVLQNVPAVALELPGLTLRRVRVPGEVRAHFDLTLWVEEEGERLAGHLEYNRDLFDAATARRFLGHLTTLLDGALAEPQRPFSRLSLLTPDEAHQLLVAWNDTGTAPAAGEAVHRAIASRAQGTPEAIALAVIPEEEGPVEHWSYSRLWRRARELARRLGRLGVGPESRVALSLPRSPRALEAMLGTLEAGGAYLPVDPAHPARRRAALLVDSGAAVLVAAGEGDGEAGELPLPPGCRRLLLPSAEADAQATGTLETGPAQVDPDGAAYVLYTSGSTGRPKGVVVSHRALAHYTADARRAYGITPGDRVLQFASLAFDASAEEIYPTLATGATLVLRSEGMLATPDGFLATCRSRAITLLNLPTAYWHQLADAVARGAGDGPAGVRVIAGGEQADARRLATWRERLGETVRWINTYGPTETTVVVTRWEPAAGEATPPVVPIGRPIGATRAYALDRRFQLVPVGVPGELWIAGPGLARGYLGRPALTAERFRPDPFAAAAGHGAGGRLYGSGDLARRRPGGELEYLGRTDHQVKVRGFRVECGEVEAGLQRHPEVREAVVVPRREPGGDHRLVAYLVLAGEATVADLRRFLGRTLPPYMVPAVFLFLDRLPVTATGKVDRRALPEPEGERPEGVAPYVAPRTPTEEVLAGIWSELLGVEGVGVMDDFFELGGHSLLVTQAIARIREACGVELPLQALFEAPTVAELAARVEGAGVSDLSPDLPPDLPPVVPVPREGELPLSFAQERIWFLTELEPGTTSYHVPRTIRARGPFDARALERAYGALLARHEILRTTFPTAGGRPVQRILPPAPFRLPVVELSGLPEGPREALWRRLMLADGRRLFELARGPMLRATLLRLGPGEHVLVQTEHHMVHDGWAEGVLLGDLLALYTAALEGRPSPLAPLPVQFADFAVWQRRWLTGEVLERQLAYWVEHLRGAPALLELPADRPRPAVQSLAGEARNFDLPPELTAAVRRLGRRRGATLFMTILAAFEALLSRYTGATDLVVGTGVANRRRRETEGMLGMAINTLALRTDLAGDPTFAQLLERVRRVCLGAYAHQDLPFEKVVEALAPERSRSHAPVFQVMFAFHDAPLPRLELPGLELEAVEAHNRSAKFDLVVIVSPRPGAPDELIAHLEWASDLFDPTTMARLWRHCEHLMEAVAADDGLRLGQVPLLAPAERWQVTGEWSDTAAPLPRERTIHPLFARQAAASPEAVVLAAGDGAAGDRVLTYRELERRAGRLARELVAAGVEPDRPVGLALERSPELVVAALAILQAGGAYLPLEAGYPQERLRFMLEDARAQVLVADPATAPRLPAVSGRPILVEEAPAGGDDGGPPAPDLGPHQLAYVTYTSGSTGKPKGVAIPQGAVVRLVRGSSYARLGPGEVLLQLAPVAFDASTMEIWGALLNGSRLEILPPGVPSLAELGEALASRRVTTLFLTTGLFHQVVERRPGDLAGVTQLLSGGEALSVPHVRRALESLPGTRLSNVYGPTENTTYTTAGPLSPARPPAATGATVPIGRPIANTRVYVVDRRLELQPPGAPGELVTGGDGLARGYLGRPGRTAGSFVPDPLGAFGERLYRTGDRVRWLPGGELEFLGRLDFQVKLRGFRIELGEIETTLVQHPAVAACAVLAREDRPGDKRLVAYAVPRPGQAPDAGLLAVFLSQRLAGFMVPAHFVFLEALPLTATGKVDRRALPAPDQTTPGGAGSGMEPARTSPATPLGRRLAGIWEEVLGVEQVALEDDFFYLGGHSLLAIRLLGRLEEELAVRLPVRELFDAPTLAGLAAAVARRLEAGGEGAVPAPAIPRRQEDGPAPLSFAQRRLWFLHQLHPRSPAYNVPAAVRLAGRLDLAALAGGLSDVAARHQALRTTFATAGEEPMQVVAPHCDLTPAVVDLSGLGPAPDDPRLDRLMTAEALRPFDLAAGPLARAILLRLGDEEHLLLLTLHHIVADGWSMGVLVEEAVAGYQARLTGVRPELPELPVQYPDYAVWQRSSLDDPTLAAELAFWRRCLAGGEPGGAPPVLELPTDRPRAAVPSFIGRRFRRRLEGAVPERLEALAREEGATPFMVLLAAFQALLARYSGQDRLLVGFPVANRRHPVLERLIGFFVNTLALPGDLTGGPGFRRLLGRVRATAVEALAHQELPFDRLVEELAPDRGAGASPLFTVMFNLLEAPPSPRPLPGLTLEPVELEPGSAKLDLILSAAPGPEGLRLEMEYASELFDRTTVARMMGHYARLLAAVAADPETPVRRLPLLAAGEAAQLLREWNDTASAYPREASLAERFARRAAERPDAAAVVDGGVTLTYGELERRAQWLARRLARRSAGRRLGPEGLVGLAVERSPAWVVAALAILRAGGAYLPLDPSYPAERLAFMLADAGAPLLLVGEGWTGALPARELEVLTLTAEGRVAGEEPVPAAADPGADGPLPRPGGDAIAYVIYTSGSTGRPKGIRVPQRAVLRLVLETDYVRLRPGDRVAQASNASFDAATYEIWGALLTGGKLVILKGDPVLAPEELARRLAEEAVDSLFVTTALFNQLAARHARALTGLRELLFGGEACDPRRVAAALAPGAGPRRLLHVYGPTENTTFTTWHPVREVPPGAATVPIGGPIANTRVQVVDRELAPVPVGVAGELVIGGDGLARGYHRRPALTAACFVPDPFSTVPGGRLYRSGDRVRRRPGGAVEFLGRFDQQVKIRGFRIEPGEVQAVLEGAPGVEAAVVVVREDLPGERRLVAYAVAPGREAGELRDHLAARLPAYLVPAAVVLLDAFPLTPNGKVDRRALPAPEETTGGEAAGEAPRGPVEELVAGLWQGLLGRQQVGRRESFFELGGHSLLATRVVAHLRGAFGVELPLKALFDGPTVAELAAAVAGALEEREARGQGPPPLTPVSRKGDLPLSAAQRRLWFLEQLSPGGVAYNVPAAVRLDGPLAVAALEGALARVVERHEALRTTFDARDGDPRQVISPPAGCPLPVVDLTALPEPFRQTAAEELQERAARRPFDLARGPLLRTRLLRLGSGEHRLLVTLHHIVSDGWSMGVLVAEVGALYPALRRGETPSLAPLPVQYADFAAWQQRWLRGETLASEIAWWRRELAGDAPDGSSSAGLPPALELPADRPRPAVQSSRGAVERFELGSALSRELEELSRRHDATLFMTLLAAFQGLLARYTGQERLTVGTPIAGRTRLELEGLIGFFVNTLVLPGDLTGDPPFTRLLERTRRRAVAAYAHQELPFEKLVEELSPRRDLARSPLFQVFFALQNAPQGRLELEGLTLTSLPLATGTAKFDLSLFLWQEGGRLAGSVEYASDLFDRTTVQRLAGHLEVLLAGVAAAPEARLSALPLLPAAQRGQLLWEANDSGGFEAAGRTLPALVAAQEERTPQRAALSCRDQVWSYRALMANARRLAGRLAALGVGPEVRVAVGGRRRPELLTALLAVLEAGGAYLPLDPAYPEERVAFMLADSGAAVLLADGELLAAWAGSFPGPAVALEEASSLRPSGERPARALPSPGNLSNVLYTSGSTGRPKGVAIEHRGAVALVEWARGLFGGDELSGVLASTSICFDLSVFELFVPWSAGGTVLLVDHVLELVESPAAARVRLINTVPSAAAELLRLGALPAPAPVVNLAGEALPRELVSALHAAGVERVYNLYGPSEDTTYSTWALQPLARRQAGEAAPPPIGRPVSGSRGHVVGRWGELVPPGVPGELLLGGAGLARAYLGRPVLTAERFVPDPWGRRAGARLYRTGDRVRRLREGELVYLGRLDHQVKVRGFRIELGEVEAALTAQPGVAEAVVTVQERASDDRRLVAWVVADEAAGEAAITAEELQEALARRLPAYMVPQAILFLEALPRTPSGKVDRRSLLALESLDRTAMGAAETTPPRNPVEEVLAGIWRRVLGAEELGVHDDFFRLGGHSLLATRLVARVRSAFRVELPVRTLFEATTVARMARTLVEHETSPGRTEKVARLLQKLEGMSDREAGAVLAAKRREAGGG